MAELKNNASDKAGACNSNDLTRPLFVILGAVGAVIGLLYIYPFLTTMFGKQKEVFTSVEQLGQSHLMLEQKVIAMQKQYDAVVKRIAALEQLENDSIKSAIDGVKNVDQQSYQTIESLKSRVDAIDSRLAARQQQMARIPETVEIFAKLRNSMQSSKPFDKELYESITLFDPQDQAMQVRLQSLQDSAKIGVPTIDELWLEFKNVAKDLKRLAIPDDLPWYSKFVSRLRNLVIVRKNGEELQINSTTEERIAGVQSLLENHDLERALTEADLLPKFESDVYRDWRAIAGKRLFIEQSIPIMEAHVLAYLLTGESTTTLRKGE